MLGYKTVSLDPITRTQQLIWLELIIFDAITIDIPPLTLMFINPRQSDAQETTDEEDVKQMVHTIQNTEKFFSGFVEDQKRVIEKISCSNQYII